MPVTTTGGCAWPRKWPGGNCQGRVCLQGQSPKRVRRPETLDSCSHQATWGQHRAQRCQPSAPRFQADSGGITPWERTVPWWKEDPSQALGSSLRC